MFSVACLLRGVMFVAAGVGLCFVVAGCGSTSGGGGSIPPPPGSTEPNNCKSTETTSPAQPAPTSNFAGASFGGTVRGGAVPIIGASVQVYAAGASGNG
jgi:hypothetical protein